MSYPFTKRFFAIPQAYLGIAFGFGIPMAFAAQLEHVPAVAWVLLLANIFWAIAYDTEYAMVDRDDDRKIGIRTAAIPFGRFDVVAVMLSHAAFLALLAGIGWRLQLAWPYYLGLAGAAVLIGYQYTPHPGPRADALLPGLPEQQLGRRRRIRRNRAGAVVEA